MSFSDLPLQLEGLRFKGDRDYLHGTDILPTALHALSDKQSLCSIGDIDIVFHALAHTGLTLRSDVLPGQKSKSQLVCRVNNKRHRLFLVEDGRPVVIRHPYPEDQIVATTIIEANSATATSSAPLKFTNIERWIAMVKALHHAIYPNTAGKWLFARAKLVSYTDAYAHEAKHQVSILSDFNGQLTRSALMVDGHRIGDIFFALS